MCVGSDKEEVGNKDRKPNNAKKKKKLRRISVINKQLFG